MTRLEILTAVQAGALSVEKGTLLLNELESPRVSSTLTCKVSKEKGALSVYGLQRMPVTLYVEQWERLLDFADQIKAFARSNDNLLTRKPR